MQKPKVTNPIANLYHERAGVLIGQLVRANKDAVIPTIQYGQPEFAAWRDYFIRLGWMPAAMQMAIADERREMTVPTRWPEWFEASYSNQVAAE